MQEGQRVRGVLAGERDGLRVYASRAACGSGSGSIGSSTSGVVIGSSTSGVVSSGPNSNFRIGVLAGERDGLRVYAVGDCYEPTVGTRHFGVLVGERDGKRVYAIDCCVPGSGSSGSGSSGSSGSESSGSSGSSTSVSGSGIGSEGSGSGSFSFSGPSGSISSGSGIEPGPSVVPTCCCPDRLLPERLYLRFSDITGGCVGCVEDGVAIPLQLVGSGPSEVQWDTVSLYRSPCVGGLPSFFPLNLYCTGTILSGCNFTFGNASITAFASLVFQSCSPFVLVFSGSFNSGTFCTGDFVATITET